jgi:hypothetical protein
MSWKLAVILLSVLLTCSLWLLLFDASSLMRPVTVIGIHPHKHYPAYMKKLENILRTSTT